MFPLVVKTSPAPGAVTATKPPAQSTASPRPGFIGSMSSAPLEKTTIAPGAPTNRLLAQEASD